MISRYLKWLQKDTPTGGVEPYPEANERYETSQAGVYIAGDLTGIPLLKLAAESGTRLVRQFVSDGAFAAGRDEAVLDVAIVGAGPAGVAAGLECQAQGLRYEILEASDKLFSTIANFPKGKPILAKPDEFQQESALLIRNGDKESLLTEMYGQVQDQHLAVSLGTMVKRISRKGQLLRIDCSNGERKARRVVLAIGKTGNARNLGIPGEDLPKVYNKLYDPSEFRGQQVLVVGGGDSALEAAIALAKSGNTVTLSYRKPAFDRPKPENQKALSELGITVVFQSTVQEIRASEVLLSTASVPQTIANDQVFILIGRELPLAFFRRSGIRMEGEKDRSYFVFYAAMLSFFTMLYFGKSGASIDLAAGMQQATEKLKQASWHEQLGFVLGLVGAAVFAISGLWALGIMVNRRQSYFKPGWPLIKYGYMIAVSLIYSWVYITYNLGRNGWQEGPTYSYSLLYCTTMLLFGIRRVIVNPTRYIKLQTTCLVLVQVFFLFLLPFHLYGHLESALGADSVFIQQVFPQGKWSAFGLILFWPLLIGNFGTSTFWTIFPFFQSGLFLFLIIRYWGKGIYCGWICSCGGMAETLGDEYRTKAPHGKTAKKLENIGQFILLFAVIATVLKVTSNSTASQLVWYSYKVSVDVFFAGVLGLGVYFFMGGRVWCRFGCPLAALMHIYTRFSKYRILAEKKKCISCNICTKVCHMGIDVMNYANKGVPMNDAECVRCSACVVSCPVDVLSFGPVDQADPDNTECKEVPDYGKESWRAGLK